jgi:hypothetical protein
MKTSSVFAATLLLWLIPCMSCAKEREFLGNYPLAFQVGDSITFTFDKDHQHALVIDGSGKKTKLPLISEGTRRASAFSDPREFPRVKSGWESASLFALVLA